MRIDHGRVGEDEIATGTEEVNADHLRAFIERIERLEEEKNALSDDIRDECGAAKGNGHHPPRSCRVHVGSRR